MSWVEIFLTLRKRGFFCGNFLGLRKRGFLAGNFLTLRKRGFLAQEVRRVPARDVLAGIFLCGYCAHVVCVGIVFVVGGWVG